MSAATLLDAASELSDRLTEYDSRIAELREEIQSYLGSGNDPDFVPLVLPVEWDFDKANEELNTLLKQRHKATTEYRQLCERQEAAARAEVKRKLAALKRQYTEAVVKMLQKAIEFAEAVSTAHALRMESQDLTGQAGHLRHVGPLCGGWSSYDLKDPYCLPALWCREAKEFGLIDGSEDWLSGVNMTGTLLKVAK